VKRAKLTKGEPGNFKIACQTRNGIPLLPRKSGVVVTPEIVNALRDELI